MRQEIISHLQNFPETTKGGDTQFTSLTQNHVIQPEMKIKECHKRVGKSLSRNIIAHLLQLLITLHNFIRPSWPAHLYRVLNQRTCGCVHKTSRVLIAN